jgi:hypothetical protein
MGKVFIVAITSLLLMHACYSAKAADPEDMYLGGNASQTCACDGHDVLVSLSTTLPSGWHTIGGSCPTNGAPCAWAYSSPNVLYTSSYTVPSGKCVSYVKFYAYSKPAVSLPTCNNG